MQLIDDPRRAAVADPEPALQQRRRAALVLDARLRRLAEQRVPLAGLGILGPAAALALLRPHQLEDVATEHFGARVSTHALATLIRDAHLAMASMPLWTGRATVDVLQQVERAGIKLFSLVRSALAVTTGDTRVPLPPSSAPITTISSSAPTSSGWWKT